MLLVFKELKRIVEKMHINKSEYCVLSTEIHEFSRLSSYWGASSTLPGERRHILTSLGSTITPLTFYPDVFSSARYFPAKTTLDHFSVVWQSFATLINCSAPVSVLNQVLCGLWLLASIPVYNHSTNFWTRWWHCVSLALTYSGYP